ncbi:MAG: hypothetical protein LC753_19660, partial [Acidobacteria bacterium]|nr:hypothetical protein [Acidobacteriota bacterium]MCA1652380.1 hypothetical protein [Acidobacteriota bacterium]
CPRRLGSAATPVSRLFTVKGLPIAVRVLGTDAAGTPAACFTYCADRAIRIVTAARHATGAQSAVTTARHALSR